MAWPTSKGDPQFPLQLASGGPTTVSTETPLLSLTEFGLIYEDLAFVLRNHDGTNKAQLIIERSQGGVAASMQRETLTVNPGKESPPMRFMDVMELFWGVSASGDPDAAFPSVSVSWQVIGKRRCR